MTPKLAILCPILAAAWILGCSSGNSTLTAAGNNPDGTNANAGVAGSGPSVAVATGNRGGGSVGSDPWPPVGFTNVTPADLGAYALGFRIDNVGKGGSAGNASAGMGGGAGQGGATSSGPARCGNVLYGVVRDFRMSTTPKGHPDFEAFNGGGTKNSVLADLGPDDKPVYAGICDANGAPRSQCSDGQQWTTKANFDQWYRDTADVNQAFIVAFQLVKNAAIYTFQSEAFFPLDGAGWGNQGVDHNFSFATEVHSSFVYHGGETFSFQGDDDLWVFINGKLAIDLGGLHSSLDASVNLDASAATLGITPGKSYEIALFHAERHTAASHFRIDTTLEFLNCGTLAKGVPIY